MDVQYTQCISAKLFYIVDMVYNEKSVAVASLYFLSNRQRDRFSILRIHNMCTTSTQHIHRKIERENDRGNTSARTVYFSLASKIQSEKKVVCLRECLCFVCICVCVRERERGRETGQANDGKCDMN